LAISSSNATEIIQLSKQLLQLCFREGLNYKKAGIMAWGLQKKEGLQMSIFENEAKHLRMAKIMTCFDQMNQKFGKGTLSTAAATVTSHNRWQRKEEHRSNRYTTSWAELLEVNANHPLQKK
jgi:DNA polymerase V